jgi:hypothetical protein
MKLFSDVHNETVYALNLYSGTSRNVNFHTIFNLYHPKTISDSRKPFTLDSKVPGIKTDMGEWETKGHPERILTFTKEELSVLHSLFGGDTTLSTRLPQIHARPLLEILKIVGKAETTIGDLKEKSFSTVMYDETYSQRDGILKREENPSFQPKSPEDLVLVGPLIFAGNPLYGSAYTNCSHNKAFDDIDLTEIPETYLPRSPYKPLKKEPFLVTMGTKPDGSPNRVDAKQYYRIAWRKMAAITGERTLMSCIIPKGVGHIDGVYSVFFRDNIFNLNVLCVFQSIIADFLTRFTGGATIRISNLKHIPIIQNPNTNRLLRHRTLRLNCLTTYYKDLWEECAEGISQDKFYLDDPRLTYEHESPYGDLSSKWNYKSPLRSDFARRLALLEIDVLVAKGFGLSLDHLLLIYNLQFPVLQQYERVDLYDTKGKRLPNTARKDPGGTQLRTALKKREEEIQSGIYKETDAITIRFPIDGNTKEIEKTFHPPFTPIDRTEEYRKIWQNMDFP